MTTDPISIPILAAGRGWLVVEKPAGLSVEEGREQDLCSLLQSRIRNDTDLRKEIDCDPRFGVHPVHRHGQRSRECTGLANLVLSRLYS